MYVTGIHTQSHGGCHARPEPAHQEPLGVQHLAQGVFRTITGEVRIGPATLRLLDGDFNHRAVTVFTDSRIMLFKIVPFVSY